MPEQIQWLARALKTAKNPLVLTGAGISVASGIAPFRGTDEAVWSRTVLEMGTCATFERDPVRQWKWYLERFDACRDAKPNAAHHALVEIDRLKQAQDLSLRLVTQNIDGLHVEAGSPDVVEIHGAARKLRCSRKGCVDGSPRGTLPWDERLFDALRATGRREDIPRCGKCHKPLRAHVLWFDEYYGEHDGYRFEEAIEWFDSSDLLVFIGTSFSVGITENALLTADRRGVPMWSIDPVSEPPISGITWIKAPSEGVLPAVVTAWDAA